DLVRGYRIDIQRFPQGFEVGSDLPAWMSLHERTGSMSVKHSEGGDPTDIALEDEGFVQPAVVQDPDDPNAPGAERLPRIPESLFHWQGWSLSVRPPVTPLDLGPDIDHKVPEAGLPQVTSTFSVKSSSLPRLRFGSRYQVRARIVDLAGNGPTLEQAD